MLRETMVANEKSAGRAASACDQRRSRHGPNRPKILYIGSDWPCDFDFGGQLRALQICRALEHMGELTVSVVSSDADNREAQIRTEESFSTARPVAAEYKPNANTWEKLRWAFDSKFLNVHGCQARGVARDNLLKSRAAYDLVWVLNSRTPNILNEWHWPTGHLDLDDIPSTYLRTVARYGRDPWARWKARVQQGLMRRREVLWKERFATLSVCSEPDRKYLGGGDQIHVIPNGFERGPGEPFRIPAMTPPRIGFIGLCTYEPNRDGVRWFLDNCWAQLRREIPGIRFRLAGKGAEEFLCESDRDVDVLGWIPDPGNEIATWSVMAIPLRFGSGTRVKLAEAFSRKCPVVSTSLGAFGYDVRNREELLLADDPREFAQACVALVRDPAMATAMADRAHAASIEKWTWDAIAPRVWAAAEDCLRRIRVS